MENHCHDGYEERLNDHQRRLANLENNTSSILTGVQDIKLLVSTHIAEHRGGMGVWGSVVKYVITAVVGVALTIVGMALSGMLEF